MNEPHAERPLPEDPDLDVDETSSGLPLPVHLHPGLLALVAAGGAAGSLARYAVTSTVGTPGDLPLGTLVVNVAGACALGVLLELLALRGSDVGRRRTARLLLGTGFLGAFTTYSALAVETDGLLRDGRILAAVGDGVGSVVLGFAAALAGILLTRRAAR